MKKTRKNQGKYHFTIYFVNHILSYADTLVHNFQSSCYFASQNSASCEISHGKTKIIRPLYSKNVNVISITECYQTYKNKVRHVQHEQEHIFLVV